MSKVHSLLFHQGGPDPLEPAAAHLTSPGQTGPAGQISITLLPVPVTAPFTEHEQAQLEAYEDILRSAARAFVRLGSALIEVRDQRLYRKTHPTFEAYCRERWAIDRSHAWRLMGAADRVNLLPTTAELPLPTSEYQVRPFFTVSARNFPKYWERAVKAAGGGKVRVARRTTLQWADLDSLLWFQRSTM